MNETNNVCGKFLSRRENFISYIHHRHFITSTLFSFNFFKISRCEINSIHSNNAKYLGKSFTSITKHRGDDEGKIHSLFQGH